MHLYFAEIEPISVPSIGSLAVLWVGCPSHLPRIVNHFDLNNAETKEEKKNQQKFFSKLWTRTCKLSVCAVFSTCCPDSALGWGVQHEINDKEHNYHGFESIKMLTSLEPLASVACVHVVHHSVWTQHSNLLHSKRRSAATDWQRSMKFCSILNIRFVLIARRRLHLPFARSQRSAATWSCRIMLARARQHKDTLH